MHHRTATGQACREEEWQRAHLSLLSRKHNPGDSWRPHTSTHRGSQLGPGQGQRPPSQEALDHPDISYVNHPLKLKWRYLFRIMVYTYSGTYLCVDFKHHIYGRIFFFFNLHLLNRKLSGIYFYFRSVFPLKIVHTFFLKSILWQHLKNTQYLVMTFIRWVGFQIAPHFRKCQNRSEESSLYTNVMPI